MKTQILILIFTALFATTLNAQQQVTVNASNYDISDNLDLRAVAYMFGESRNLEEFEQKLNDPELQISNLDLNYDGYIDYLRVVEVGKNKIYVVTIQAVLGENVFQDVATIDVEIRNKKTMYVQVIGNSYVYGRNYIIEPVFVHRPVIIDFYVRPRRVVWASPWYWGYYPSYYYYRQPRAVHVYHHHVYNYYGPAFKCHYVHYRPHQKSAYYHQKVHRNDWAKKHPDKSFEHRNEGVDNHYELNKRRSARINQQPAGAVTKSVPTNNRRSQSEGYSNNPNTRNATRANTNNAQPAKSVEKSKSVTVETGTNRRSVQNNEQKSQRVYSPSSTSSGNQPRNTTRTTSVEKKTNSPAKSTTVNRPNNEMRKPAQTTSQPEKPKQVTSPARRSEQSNSVNKSSDSKSRPEEKKSTSSSARQQASPSKQAAEKSSSTRNSSPARSTNSNKSETSSSSGRR